jgi:hypothetical protein
MKKIEVQMSLIKTFMEVQKNMLNSLCIICFYNVVGWFDG